MSDKPNQNYEADYNRQLEYTQAANHTANRWRAKHALAVEAFRAYQKWVEYQPYSDSPVERAE